MFLFETILQDLLVKNLKFGMLQHGTAYMPMNEGMVGRSELKLRLFLTFAQPQDHTLI
jgi:hypothetical protein